MDSGSTTYVYNAAGMRVRKTTGGVSVDYLYDLAGNAVTELNTSGGWTRKEVYAGSRHVATYKDGIAGQTYFSHGDWLGTERARTDKNGAVTETCTNLPFGDAQTCTGTSVSPLHFTGKQRDTETDNDYFGARYYVSRQGRWLTPDWSSRGEAVPYASLGNPQTLNLYAYVGNNPVSTADADGHVQAMAVGRGPGNEAIAGFTGSIFGDALFLPGGGISIGLASSPALASSGTLTSTRQAVANALADPAPQQTVSAEDMAAGNFAVSGQRPLKNWLLRILCLNLCKHSYVGIPEVKDGAWTGNILFYEVVGNKGFLGFLVQKVHRTDADSPEKEYKGTHEDGGHDRRVFATATQRNAVFASAKNSASSGNCPSCGFWFHNYWLLTNNSNTWASRVLRGAGITPPRARPITPGFR